MANHLPFAMGSHILLEYKPYRAMVGTKDIRVYQCIFQPVFKAFRYKEIIDPPSCIFCPGTELIGPPRIDAFFVGIEITERIYETGLGESREFFSFIIGETGIFTVGFWVFQVDFFVRYVQVTAKNDRLGFFQFFYIMKEIVFPPHPVI